jgi:hypothetical protein
MEEVDVVHASVVQGRKLGRRYFSGCRMDFFRYSIYLSIKRTRHFRYFIDKTYLLSFDLIV